MTDTVTCPQCGTLIPVETETTHRETIETTVDVTFDWIGDDDDYTPPPLEECSVEDCCAWLNIWEEGRGTCNDHTPDEYGITPADCYCSQGSDNMDQDVCHLHWAAIKREGQ